MKTISPSSKSKAAADALLELYKAGKVFAGKKNPEVQRNPDVYLAACALADEIGKDLAKHVKGKASGQGCYEILHNMKAILRRRVGPGRCAVGIYDFETRTCSYAGSSAADRSISPSGGLERGRWPYPTPASRPLLCRPRARGFQPPPAFKPFPSEK